ncbi:MAG: hypothetical protein GX616_26575, partial [Planctomycetes bacterium]|nr:hypothetical protein [Planctomycetota bacterium]
MGILDELLQSTLLKAIEDRPDLPEEQWEEVAQKAVVESFPKVAELLWESLR